jgi:hypothetical protein
MLTALCISIIAFVYGYVLTSYGMLLSGVRDYLEQRLPTLLYYPLIGCEKCIAGQMSLWYYIYITDQYIWQEHLMTVSLSILLVAPLKASYCTLEKIIRWSQN